MKCFLSLIIPLALLLHTCEREDRQWVTIDPIQCMGNPWEQAWLEENNDDYQLWAAMDDLEKLNVFKQYYENLGIVIHRLRQSTPYEATCLACSCLRGDRIHCYINEDDTQQMLKLGFEIE